MNQAIRAGRQRLQNGLPIGGGKGPLRQNLLARRRALPAEQRAEQNAAIVRRIRDSARWRTARTIVAYASLPEEVDTWPLLQAALREGKKLVLPRIERRDIEWHAVTGLARGSDLTEGPFGILEPAPAAQRWRPMPGDEPVLWLIPGVGYDRCGTRLGHGAGYYDRALRGAQARRNSVGLAYSCQRVDIIPAAPWDWPVESVVTPDEWIVAANPSDRR